MTGRILNTKKGIIFSLLGCLMLFGMMSIPNVLNAQNTGGVIGMVVESSTNSPLPGANVFIKGSYWGAATDVAGEFIIPNVPVGIYKVTASFVGYKSITKEIKVTVNNKYTIVAFSLQ